MAQITSTTPSDTGWQRSLAAAIRDPDELVEALDLPGRLGQPARRAAELFGLLVPGSYLARMRRGDPADPLLRQVLPLEAEFDVVEGFTQDAVGDADARRAPGLIHKYAGRALLISTGACPVHCRYCFRRHYPYGSEPRRLDDWEPAFETIAGDDSLEEIILSGGEPLMLTDTRLAQLVERLQAIGHLRRLRVHTRMPIVLPDRVTDRLLSLLTETRLTTVVVVHANHPAEVAADCAEALGRLVRSGLTVLNQAVLLAGVNDDLDVLVELCTRLIDLGVVPYYLHQLDRVAGTAHFEVPESRGLELARQLEARLPGYAVPQYVREVAGALGKVRLA